MLIRTSLLILPLVLAGCLPVSTYYRAGISPSRLQSDTTACEVRALRDAPVVLRTEVSPPIWVPARRSCSAPNVCSTQPGYYRHGHVYQVDVNKALRARVETQCMADKGYNRVQIKACQNGEASIPATGAANLPPLTARSCALRNQDGTLRVLNQE